MKIHHFFILLILLSFSFGKAQNVEGAFGIKNLAPADSILKERKIIETAHFPKKFEKEFKSKYKGKEFDYELKEAKESFWSKLKKRFQEFFSRIFSSTDPRKTGNDVVLILRIMAGIIVFVALCFGLRFFLSKEGNFFFSKKNKKINIHNQDLVENIHEINFPNTILHHEKNKDYRSAVRYQFLHGLKNLTDKKIIDWNPEKTNEDYIQELKKEHLKIAFSELVYIYDYVWYGDFAIDEMKYKETKQVFENFKTLI